MYLSDETKKMMLYSLVGAGIFAVVSLPNIYMSDYKVFSQLSYGSNCSTPLGFVVYGVMYLLLHYFIAKIMNDRAGGHHSDSDLFKWSIYGALLYYFISNRDLYSLTSSISRRVLGVDLANQYGCPNVTGVFIHSVVYFSLVMGLMKIE